MEAFKHTTFFIYKDAFFFPKEFLIKGGVYYGGYFEKSLPLNSKSEFTRLIEQRLNIPKPVIEDPAQPSLKDELPIYKAMGFASWRKLHQNAISCGIYEDDLDIIFSLAYPGDGDTEGQVFETNCHDNLEMLWETAKKHAETLFK